jgi:hypothetical protein
MVNVKIQATLSSEVLKFPAIKFEEWSENLTFEMYSDVRHGGLSVNGLTVELHV